MSQCDVAACNDSASHRVERQGVVIWLCDLHRAGLNDALHLPSHPPPRVTHKTNRFDTERRLDVPACPQPSRSRRNTTRTGKRGRGNA